MENKVLYKVEGLSKSYQMGDVEVKALQEVSFEIGEGEFVVILGPSGSGKSTLLNIMGGMDKPSAGKVFFKEQEVTRYDDRKLTQFRRRDVGFIFQFYNLIGNLTARENVELAVEICDEPLDVEEMLEAVGLEERSDHFPAQMSGGEQQRVAIARAAAKNPEILLCDEPTGALDFETGISILQVLKMVNERYGRTVVVITHNAPIAQMADRVLKMRSGKVMEDYRNSQPLDPKEIVW
ncbi:ABC transporter ATP-binding protein [Anaerotalea alkaliphila]|uniref:ABC transporter ATP-binding protein n=1 Tax=Anaerotalea alkaliphila TaxID=2662126 RepID=A0A7X5HTX1_9FIRM|nr:ABC transporter ATP-binding protein [Anaerotalea alkaliphila]NDL66605.1 ABC transporter ATP-binding protein [Anaerotalea alkaliphila]